MTTKVACPKCTTGAGPCYHGVHPDVLAKFGVKVTTDQADLHKNVEALSAAAETEVVVNGEKMSAAFAVTKAFGLTAQEAKANLSRALALLRADEPCGHPGCLSHVTHPCEGCGRVAGVPRPRCYNRPAFSDTLAVQDGWTPDGRRNMVTIANPMSKECQQWEDFGEARRLNWNCGGCAHDPRAAAGENING